MHNQRYNGEKLRAADAKFAPHREQAAAALRADKLTLEEIQQQCCATNRHIRQLAKELNIDLQERGRRVMRNTKQAMIVDDLNLTLLKRHIDDVGLSFKAIAEAHKINYPLLREACERIGIDYESRKLAYEQHGRKIRGTKANDLVIRMEMIERSMSGDGMSLEWLRRPWRAAQ